jgi:hypothetical protein
VGAVTGVAQESLGNGLSHLRNVGGLDGHHFIHQAVRGVFNATVGRIAGRLVITFHSKRANANTGLPQFLSELESGLRHPESRSEALLILVAAVGQPAQAARQLKRGARQRARRARHNK